MLLRKWLSCEFDCPTERIEHFLALKVNCHNSDQDVNLLRSLCKMILLFLVLYSSVSFAESWHFEEIHFGRSLMYKRKKEAPILTPVEPPKECHRQPTLPHQLQLPAYDLLKKLKPIMRELLIPYLSSLKSSLRWFTVSKALEKSNIIASVISCYSWLWARSLSVNQLSLTRSLASKTMLRVNQYIRLVQKRTNGFTNDMLQQFTCDTCQRHRPIVW